MTPPTEGIPLVPRRSVPTRLVVLGVLTAFVLVGRAPWLDAAICVLITAAILGTYPESSIRGDELERRFRVVFRPLGASRYSLKVCTHIETGLEDRPSMEMGLLMGPWNWVMYILLDKLFPWFGGDYKIWLRTARGNRVLAWQGNGYEDFRTNLEALEKASGLPVVRG